MAPAGTGTCCTGVQDCALATPTAATATKAIPSIRKSFMFLLNICSQFCLKEGCRCRPSAVEGSAAVIHLDSATASESYSESLCEVNRLARNTTLNSFIQIMPAFDDRKPT